MPVRNLVLAILLVLTDARVASAATSDWMEVSDVKAYMAQLKAQGRIPVKVECKAGEGYTLLRFTRVRITDGPDPGNVSFKWGVNSYGTLSKNKANLERAARNGMDVKAMGGKLEYKSFVRFESPVSGEPYGCELIHLTKAE